MPVGAKFCPHCGVALAEGGLSPRSRLGGRGIGLIVLGTAVSLGFGLLSMSRLGTKPTVTYEELRAKSQVQWNDNTVQSLRDAVKGHPNDKGPLTALADALFTKLRTMEQPPSELIFETIDVLKEILKVDPNNGFALLSLGDISFNQQVFNKALEYYEHYVKLFPENVDAKARYASALSFNGKVDEAQRVLQEVLKKEPKNFNAQAYLAITYAQKGDKERALKVGEDALASAPSEEARERFAGFLASIREEKQTASSSPNPTQQRGVVAETGVGAIEAFIRANAVAGPKFVRAEKSSDAALHLYFSNFPMDQMPPFVRDKFVQGVREKVASALDGDIKQIRFLDVDSGKELFLAELAGESSPPKK